MSWLVHGLTWPVTFPAVRTPDWRAKLLLLLALLVAVSNPLACWVHCWVHTHPFPLVAPVAQVASHAHHTGHHAQATALSTPAQQPEPPRSDETLCRNSHVAPSPLTIAVLLVFVLLTLWFTPSFTWQPLPLFVRLPEHPPPRRPPRL